MSESVRKSRRAVLAAAAGAAALTATKALAQPLAVRAAGNDGATIHVGDTIADAQSQTTLANRANNERVLWVASNADVGNGNGIAITGYSNKNTGVEGQTDTGTAVRAISNSGNGLYAATAGGFGSTAIWGNATSNGSGVYATAGGGIGIVGHSNQYFGAVFTTDSASYPGVVGQGRQHSAGVEGYSGTGASPEAPTMTGVYGIASQGTSSRGVWGESPSGRGVYGHASTGVGVFGESDDGYALRTRGRVKVEKVSGVATIKAGQRTVTVTPGVNVTSGSFVLLTPKSKLSGRDLWFSTSPTANTITIRMSSARSTATKIAWLMLG